jgi:hypothetical protein
MIEKTDKKKKRLPKGQRAHIRKLKSEAGKMDTVYRPPLQ